MVPVLLFLLAIAVLGTVAYAYLRQEQDKIIAPKDRYDAAWNEFYKQIPTTSYPTWASSTRINRVFIFLGTFALALPLAVLLLGIFNGINTVPASLFLLSASLFYLPIFPIGLIKFTMPEFDNEYSLLIGWIPYIVICSLGVFIKNRRVFIVIYFVFIALLIMNIVGCDRILQETDLSGIN